jgi:phospholipase/carboxylesterase
MNRIQYLVEEELGSSLLSLATEAELPPAPASDAESSHRIFTPLHYERNYAYPLIVWLHGPHDDEEQVTQVMPLVSLRNYVGVGPRGTLAAAGLADGYSWSQNGRHIMLAEQRVMAAVAAARRWLNIAPSRIYLAGYGCGGTMAFRIALNQPSAFAGVLSLGGAFPTTLRPLCHLHAARRLKILLISGRDSRQYSAAQVCDNLRLLHSAGMSISLRQYPCGDDLTTQMFSDMDRWIMEELNAAQVIPSDQAQYRSGGK